MHLVKIIITLRCGCSNLPRLVYWVVAIYCRYLLLINSKSGNIIHNAVERCPHEHNIILLSAVFSSYSLIDKTKQVVVNNPR